MDELQRVCQTLLDNADLDVFLDGFTTTIRLHFTVGGSLEEVIFECTDFHLFKMVKDPDDYTSLFVAETSVTAYDRPDHIAPLLRSHGWAWSDEALPQMLYRINIRGGVEIDILCRHFKWTIQPPNRQQG